MCRRAGRGGVCLGRAEPHEVHLRHVHGFSVWAVCGGEGLQTDYHMDYAEVFRRRTNIVAPAIHAATLQVSPVAAGGGDVEGGTFGAHAGGLAHYQAHGYKTRTRPAPDGKPTQDWGDDGGWSYAPYAAPRDSGRAIRGAQFAARNSRRAIRGLQLAAQLCHDLS